MTAPAIILPAHEEAAHLPACLDALLAQRLPAGCAPLLIVVPNACTDATEALARARIPDFAAAGWRMEVIATPRGGKPHALNLGDAAAPPGGPRIYLDADVVMGPGLLAGLLAAVAGPGARYAGGRLRVPCARSPLSRAYARFWQRLPFVAEGVPGAGLFAVNAQGRARWRDFPDLISDDGFVRLHFARHERHLVDADYAWPITEGFGPLVRVRRRQDAGMAQIARLHPALMSNAQGDRPDRGRILRLAQSDPAGFAAYAAVALAVRLRRSDGAWARGR